MSGIGCSRPQVFDAGHHRHDSELVWQAVTDWGGHAVMTSGLSIRHGAHCSLLDQPTPI